MSSIFGKKKKHPKQTVNVNNSHAQARPHIHSPGNSGFSDTSGYHSRNHSLDNGSQSSYSFQDNAPSSSSTRHSDTSSIRNSVVFSPGDWLSYYKENFGGNKEPPRPSDDEIENLFLDLMNKRDLNKLSDSQRKLIPVDQKWVLVKNDMLQEEKSLSNPTNIVASAHDKNTPEYYLKKILDRSITVEDLNSLGVSLRTLTI
ncbi:8799_t:CDS:2, partial [Funneliformis caledonium]